MMSKMFGAYHWEMLASHVASCPLERYESFAELQRRDREATRLSDDDS